LANDSNVIELARLVELQPDIATPLIVDRFESLLGCILGKRCAGESIMEELSLVSLCDGFEHVIIGRPQLIETLTTSEAFLKAFSMASPSQDAKQLDAFVGFAERLKINVPSLLNAKFDAIMHNHGQVLIRMIALCPGFTIDNTIFTVIMSSALRQCALDAHKIKKICAGVTVVADGHEITAPATVGAYAKDVVKSLGTYQSVDLTGSTF